MTVDWQRAKYGLRNAWLCAFAFAFVSVLAIASTVDKPSAMSFIKTSGTNFTLDGKPFFVTGVNNHYLTYGSQVEVTRVLDDAVAMGANVVRTFLQPVIGSLDGSVPTIWDWRLEGEASNLAVKGTYLLYWDPSQNRMAINDGANGMKEIAASQGRTLHTVAVPWQLVSGVLKAAEALHVPLPFRSDSILGLVRPAPEVPGAERLKQLGIEFRSFSLDGDRPSSGTLRRHS